jgi:hypothetical protein
MLPSSSDLSEISHDVGSQDNPAKHENPNAFEN